MFQTKLGRSKMNTNKKTSIDSMIAISIGDFKRIGLFKPCNSNKPFAINLVHHHQTHTLLITLIDKEANSSIRLSYEINGKPIEYNIELVPVLISSTQTHTYNFVCSFSNRLCRKLYLIDDYFQHRKAKGNIYHSQSLSKKQRLQFKQMVNLQRLEKIIEQRSRKYFKTHYAHILTKRNKRVMTAHKQLKTQIA